MKYNEEQIGKLIKQEREKKGMTQTQLASKLFVTNKQISNYERGKPIPPLDKMLDLCDVFGCELGYLLGEEKYQNETQIKTAVCNSTGLSIESVQSILNLVTDKWNGDINIQMLNRLFTASLLQKFLADLSIVDSILEKLNSIDKSLEVKYGDDVVKEAWDAYQNQHVDYQHDMDYQNEHPELFRIMFEIDQVLDKKVEIEGQIDIARYRLNKTMEAMIDEMYPISKYSSNDTNVLKKSER